MRAQTDDDWELVITDDASSDDSRAVIDHWLDTHGVVAEQVRPDTNLGLTSILNLALARCRGDFVLQLGGDDVLDPHRIAAHRSAMAGADESVAVIYSDARAIDVEGRDITPSLMEESGALPAPAGQVFERLLAGNFVPGCAATYRRAAVEAVGGWDEDLLFEDWDLLLRLAARHRFEFVPGTVVSYRIHPDSMMRRRFPELVEARLTLLEKWLGHDPAHDRAIITTLRDRSWRLYKACPDLARDHVRTSYRDARDPVGRLRRRIAESKRTERAFERVRPALRLAAAALRRVSGPLSRRAPA